MQRTEDLRRLGKWIEMLGHCRPLLAEMHDERIDQSYLQMRTLPLVISCDRIQRARKLSAQRLDQSLCKLIMAECLNGSPRRLSELRKCLSQRVRQNLVVETFRKAFRRHDVNPLVRKATRQRTSSSLRKLSFASLATCVLASL